jgi:phosphoserine phosphatase
MKLALFDLDGTLLPTDSDHAFGEFMVTLGWVDGQVWRQRNDDFFAQYQAGTLNLAEYVAFATSAWRERSLAEAEAARERFMQEVIGPALHERARRLVDGHLEAGDLVAVVTATNEFVTRPIATAFGVAHLLAVELERDAQGPPAPSGGAHLPRRQGHPGGSLAGGAGPPLGRFRGCAVLQRFHQRPAAAGEGALARGHQPHTGPGQHRAGARLAHPEPFRDAMIRKIIDKLLGKSGAPSGKSAIPQGRRVEIPASEHGIDPALLDDRAVKVVGTLQQAGYEAYIVGGAVRDLLVGRRPKDFDVATNATPEQVKSLFRRAFIIGRRFRIVHVVFGRGREHEVIEVSTFRAYMDASAAEQVEGNEKTSKGEMAGKSHVVDASGRVLRDNVWGPQIEDAARRDFTINAMYYDPATQVVVDYHGG